MSVNGRWSSYQGVCYSNDSSDESEPPQKKRKKHKHNREKPMIIAVCTPLMYRAHKLINSFMHTDEYTRPCVFQCV